MSNFRNELINFWKNGSISKKKTFFCNLRIMIELPVPFFFIIIEYKYEYFIR
jgi:hypothetical protein